MAEIMTKGTRHRLIVDVILAAFQSDDEPTWDALLEKLAKVVPDGRAEDLQAAWEDAHGIWLERIEMEQAQAEAHKTLGRLFEGMPEDMTLIECARIKAAQGDPLAIEYLRQEAKSEGGANG